MGARVTEQQSIPDQITRILELLRGKLGVRASTLALALAKAKPRLPSRIYKDGMALARAEPLADHPKLRMTLDHVALDKSAAAIQTYLEAIDLADQRKGRFLGMLGGLSFNLILFCVLLMSLLIWRGFI